MNGLFPLLNSFLIIFLAELGDKTQLLTLGFAAKYKSWIVVSAVGLATSVLMAIAVTFGGAISRLVPEFYLQLAAGMIFIGFGVWTLLGSEENNGAAVSSKDGRGAFMLIFTSFFLAELGDKTQLATFGLAARYGEPLSVWLGATLGMLLVNVLAVLAGTWINKLVPQRTVKFFGAGIFIFFGCVTLIQIFF
jgi:putative Ca2+/H+ antiporter (TMEM165/GDT1 family)